jgi:hypothetical protein
MIIAVSIVDKHKPAGHRHVGTYMFEIERPNDSHFDILTHACPPGEYEDKLRPFLNRLLQKDEIPDAVDGEGNPKSFASRLKRR